MNTPNNPSAEQIRIDIVAREFELDPDLTYLNHAAVSPWPKCTKDAVTNFAFENHRYGSENYARWIKTETELRHKIKTLINAQSHEDIALVKNTSEALSFVAYGLPWQPGDNIVITSQEFPSNHIVWQSLASQGVELRIANVSSYDGDRPENALIESCDKNTRLIAVSSIQYGSGLKLNLMKIGDHCHKNGILFLIDAIQSIGALEFNLQQCKAHFVMADGHKWMLGPEGMGFFYCSPEQREKLTLTQYGWHMVEEMGNYQNPHWQIANSARRFECGSPNMTGIHALNTSLSLILELGMGFIEKRVLDNTRLLLNAVENSKNLELVSPASCERLGGIVTFRHRKRTSSDLYRELMNNRVMCADRGGGVRFSPHFYTKQALILKAIEMADRGVT